MGSFTPILGPRAAVVGSFARLDPVPKRDDRGSGANFAKFMVPEPEEELPEDPAPQLPVEITAPVMEDVTRATADAALLMEAEARGRALAQAEVAALRRELERERKQLMEQQGQLEDLLGSLKGVQDTLVKETRAAFADVFVLALRRVTSGVLVEKDAAFKSHLEGVVNRMAMEPDVVLRCAPTHQKLASEACEGQRNWRVEVDPNMKGGVVAEGRRARIDASLDTVLEGLEEAVRAWLEGEGAV